MIKLIAFDWNGTILSDTLPALRASNQTFKIYKLKPISLLKFQQTFKIPIKDFWYANGASKNIDFLKQSLIYHSLYEKEEMKARTRSGVKELLDWLGKNHITRMIYSNHIAPNIIEQLIRLDIHQFFDEILGRPANDHSHVHNRGKDEKLFEYVKKNKLKPKEVLTIGDTEEEIEIGKKAGYFTVGITGGFNTQARLKKHNPDYIIHNMKELIKIVKLLNESKN